MTEKEVRKILKEELETFLKNFEQISKKVTEDTPLSIQKGTDEKISEVKEMGIKRSKVIFELERERRKAIKDMIWCLEEMKRLHYLRDKEEYNELVKQYHETMKIHDTVLWELN